MAKETNGEIAVETWEIKNMSDAPLHNAFNTNGLNSVNNANTSANVGVTNNNNAGNNSGNNNFKSGTGGGTGGGGDKSDRPSVFMSMFTTMANNPLGQKVLVTLGLLIIAYLVYAIVLLPTAFEKPSKSTTNTEQLYSYERETRRKKPSFLKKLFCRGGRNSSFCSIDEYE